jgi:hypothetical protein
VFLLTRVERRLAERRRLLVAEDAGDRRLAQERRVARLAVDLEEERISGIIERGTPKSARMSSRHFSVFRSMKSVREAFVTSVACTPPSGRR